MIMRHSVPIAAIAVTVLLAGTIAQATQTTDRIEASAKASYVFKNMLKGDNVDVEAGEDGVVTLTGTVSTWARRSLAEEVVVGLDGVNSVTNKIEVKNGQPPENSDVWLQTKIATTLMFHKNVSALKTDVSIKDGVVTLKGEASSTAQKDLTTEYVKDIEGVQSVTNNMKVVAPEKSVLEKTGDFIDDASITAQVKLALMFHRSTSAMRTKVVTNNGIVTVSGEVKNAAEKDLVGKLVNNINGVKGLTNSLVIGKVSMK